MPAPKPQIGAPISGSGISNPEEQLIKLIVILSVIAFLLQVIIAPNIAINNIAPNFMLVALLIIAMIASQRTSVICGFILGLIFDLISSGPIGAMALAFSVVGFLFPMISKNISLNGILNWLVLVAACAFAVNLIYGIILAIMGFETSFFASIIFTILPLTIYDTVVGLLGWLVVRGGSSGKNKKSMSASKLKL